MLKESFPHVVFLQLRNVGNEPHLGRSLSPSEIERPAQKGAFPVDGRVRRIRLPALRHVFLYVGSRERRCAQPAKIRTEMATDNRIGEIFE